MPRPNVHRPPNRSLGSLLEEARQLGLEVAVPASVRDWPLWPADHPYRRYSCDKKAPFLYAEGVIDEAIRVFRATGNRLRVYPCPMGVHFHLTKRFFWEEWPVEDNA